MIDVQVINGLIETEIARVVKQQLGQLIQTAIDNLVLDQQWIEKIEAQVNQSMTERMLLHVSHIDLNSLLVDEIDNGLDRWKHRLLENFNSNGIADQATETQLTVNDDMVLVSKSLVASGLQVAHDATVSGNLDVNNLIVRGVINTDNSSWDEITSKAAEQALKNITPTWQAELTAQVLELAKQQGIAFDEITLNGQTAISGNALGEQIIESNLQSLGQLRNLEVKGLTSLHDGTVVVANRRLGVNTESPEMALSVWDEEVSLIAGKIAKNTAFVGTSRKQNLSLGVNRNSYLTIDADGLTTINSLRVDRWRISHHPEVPGWSGTRGDIVFNSDPKPDSAFAWVCLGSYRWQVIKGMS